MTLSLRCLVIGHDDRIARSPVRLWLQCDHCGRETAGWQLARETWPAVDNSRSDSAAKMAAAASVRKTRSCRQRAIWSWPFARVTVE